MGQPAPTGTDTQACSPSAHPLPPPRTHRITITNFCLGKHLVSEGDLLKDQRGSPAYISPDVLSGTCGVPGSGPGPTPSQGSVGRSARGAGASVAVQTSTVPPCAKFGALWERKMATLTPCVVSYCRRSALGRNETYFCECEQWVLEGLS